MSQPVSQSGAQPVSQTELERFDEALWMSMPVAVRAASKPATSPTLHGAAHEPRNRTTQGDVFTRHLTNWASNHDSSTSFHGSIKLHPQGAIWGGAAELGKSVNCILTSANSTKNIVIRLFQSQRHSGDVRNQSVQGDKAIMMSSQTANRSSTSAPKNTSKRKMIRTQQSRFIAPYKMVIRSGSGWVPAREYLDKHYFATLARPELQITPRLPVGIQHHVPHPQHVASPRPAWADLTDNSWGPELVTTPKPSVQNISGRTHPEHLGISLSRKDTVTISPLFRPFLKLPVELQDAILYQAVGYTRCIRLTYKESPLAALLMPEVSKPPITMSTLFRLSKTINERMTGHIFRSTNFHFGITGFTKFLWQLGPVNRSKLQHLTFHFGRGSLLHCIRWLAPDEIYELFEPPVVTSPANLTYFWRCQLRDLMRELKLLTLTIDTRDVPLADVPMLVRILDTAMGSVERIRVIDNHVPTGIVIEEYAQNLLTRFPYMPKATWRQLSLRYFLDYKHERFHMRHVWWLEGMDISPVLQLWMDGDKAFFDS